MHVFIKHVLFACLFIHTPDILNHYRTVCQWVLLALLLMETIKYISAEHAVCAYIFNYLTVDLLATKASEADKYALALMEALFTDEELAQSCYSSKSRSTKTPLPKDKLEIFYEAKVSTS